MAKLVLLWGVRIMLMPMASAVEHSSSCSARRQAWEAVSAEEHAVSYETHGPCSPNRYDMRPAATEWDAPVEA